MSRTNIKEYSKKIKLDYLDKRTKVSLEDINLLVESETYSFYDNKLTICVLTLINGYKVLGQSACVDTNEFNMELGKKYAKEVAINKVWYLEAYLLQEYRYLAEL
jgi:hypothetical protein